jgi:hypothetical protein
MPGKVSSSTINPVSPVEHSVAYSFSSPGCPRLTRGQVRIFLPPGPQLQEGLIMCPGCGTDTSDLVYDDRSGYTECEACGLIFRTEPGKPRSSQRARG